MISPPACWCPLLLCQRLFEFIKHSAQAFERPGERLRIGRADGRSRLFEFEHKWNVSRHGSEDAVPVDRSFVGRQMVITFATIVMDMCGDDEAAQDFEARHDAALEMRVSGIEAQLHIRQARLLEKIFQICGGRHFAGRVLKRNRNAPLFCE